MQDFFKRRVIPASVLRSDLSVHQKSRPGLSTVLELAGVVTCIVPDVRVHGFKLVFICREHEISIPTHQMTEHQRVVGYAVLVIVQILGHNLCYMQYLGVRGLGSRKYVNAENADILGETRFLERKVFFGDVSDVDTCGNSGVFPRLIRSMNLLVNELCG